MVSYEQMFLFLRLIFSYLFMSETEKFVCRAKRNYLETRAKKIIFLIAFGNNRTEKISCVYVIRICDDNMNRFGCVLSSLIVFRLLTDLKWKKSHGCFDFLEVFFSSIFLKSSSLVLRLRRLKIGICCSSLKNIFLDSNFLFSR